MRDEIFYADPAYDALDTATLRARLNATKTERARATAALARRAGRDHPDLQNEVIERLNTPAHREYRTMGTVSLSHIALACLWITGDEAAHARVRRIVETWPEPDRTDLRWFLTSQEIDLDFSRG